MIKTCLYVTFAFLTQYQHTHQFGWFMYNFTDGKNNAIVHTWVSQPDPLLGDKELIKLWISKDNNLDSKLAGKLLKKTTCNENGKIYTAYEVKLK